ncbi:LmeA family phospholipid-binding protein [Williamsia sp. 1135]|uniref:LmeA family phospholipid-binding protein n=1 Tax=Williamsia sp. 1135 TaxID=1889262 RepID=UPI00143C9639|nr:LmeA family phospholipid-binding protein [Williamsia sp. 1135]
MRKLLAGVLIVLCVATVADFSVAAYAEYRYSRALRAASDLDFDPEVTITGFPFIAQAAGDDYEQIGITARGTDLGEGRRGDLRSRLSGVHRIGGDWVITESTQLRVDEVTGSLKIDSVNLGRFLGIEDLTVTTPAPEDKAGGGGPGDGILSSDKGIVLTGTVNLPDKGNSGHTTAPQRERVSVSADLSVRDGALRIDATSLYSGSADHVESDVADAEVPFVLAQFSQTLPVLPLPWSLRAVSAASQGSDVVVDGEPKPLVVTARDFLPGS